VLFKEPTKVISRLYTVKAERSVKEQAVVKHESVALLSPVTTLTQFPYLGSVHLRTAMRKGGGPGGIEWNVLAARPLIETGVLG
jgi:hypothetical protein